MSTKLEWYGYQLDTGSMHVKRYFAHGDIREAKESDFVARVTGPFNAKNKEEAMDILIARFGHGNSSKN